MQLSIADHVDALQIIHQVYGLWSAGLKKEHYRKLFWSTYQQAWAKHNICRMVHKIKNEVAVSCKTSRLSLIKKNRSYQILGLGAVFTAPNRRNHGLASGLIESVIDQAKEQRLDGILLFSAIDTNFYASFGFMSLGSLDFEIYPQNYLSLDSAYGSNITIESRSAEALCQADRSRVYDGQDLKLHFSSFDPWFSENELMEILRCHNRWVVRQPYGIIRDRHYFSFQLARFLYFATYSTTNKAAWFLTIVKNEQKEIIGYAITECSGTSMRILELVGEDMARAYLWQSLIEQAKNMDLIRVCGFESLVRDFIPGCHLDRSFITLKPLIKPSNIQCYERIWSQPMFLPMNTELEDLFASHPCPLLEFDYF